MHVIFGVTTLLMLVGTIWMLAKDHNREWRKWQLEDRDREAWTIEAQLTQAKVESQSKRAELEDALAAAQANKIDLSLVERFKQLVVDEEMRLAGEDISRAQPNFNDLDAAMEDLKATEEGSSQAADARREVLDKVGPLDEAFGMGLFEDDDFSMRMRQAGFRVACAEDAYVHHVGQGSFHKLAREEYDALWQRNQEYFQKKWGVEWRPHQTRQGVTAPVSKVPAQSGG